MTNHQSFIFLNKDFDVVDVLTLVAVVVIIFGRIFDGFVCLVVYSDPTQSINAEERPNYVHQEKLSR